MVTVKRQPIKIKTQPRPVNKVNKSKTKLNTKSKKQKKPLFGKKKKKQTEPEQLTAIEDLVEDGDNTSRADIVRQHLKGPSKLLGDGELNLMIKMDMPIEHIQKRMQSRVMLAMIMAVAGFIIGMTFSKLALGLMGGLIFAGFTWYLDIKRTNQYFQQFALSRQIAFSQFTRLAAAYLPEMGQGENLYAIFDKILPRMENKRDNAALQRLMINMQKDPEDQKPFLEFAHEFSVDDSAELVMLSIQQMYLGDVDDENIRALANGANEDMISQVDKIIGYKIQKFNTLTTRIALCSMIVIMGYFALLIGHVFSSSFGSITKIIDQ